MLHWSAWLLIFIYFFLGIFPSVYTKIKEGKKEEKK